MAKTRTFEKEYEQFLKTKDSIEHFARLMYKVKNGAKADVNIELNRDECQALIWAMQLMREGKADG